MRRARRFGLLERRQRISVITFEGMLPRYAGGTVIPDYFTLQDNLLISTECPGGRRESVNLKNRALN